jgi:hypothetical protein
MRARASAAMPGRPRDRPALAGLLAAGVLCCAAGAGASQPSSTALAASPPSSTVPAASPPKTRSEGSVVQVTPARAYLDAGLAEGVRKGATLKL